MIGPTDSERAECDLKVAALQRLGFAVVPNPRDVGCCAYTLIRSRPGVDVTLRIALKDWQAPTSDVVLTNMTVQPESFRSRGYGAAVIVDLLSWAREQGLAHEVRATQVSNDRSRRFWERFGFVALPGHPCGDLVLRSEWPVTTCHPPGP